MPKTTPRMLTEGLSPAADPVKAQQLGLHNAPVSVFWVVTGFV